MKTCTKCQKEKPENQFSWKIAGKRRQSKCKICARVAVRKHFRDHTDYYLDRNKRKKQELREKYFNFLQSKNCVDCGEKDPVVLVPDHVRGKKVAGISQLIRNVGTWEAIERELSKCDIRCANCHARKTAKEQSWFKNVPFV